MKRRKRKDDNWISRLLKVATLILILLLLLNLTKDYNTYLTQLQKTLDDNSRRIHNLEREIVKLKLQNQTYAKVLAAHEKRLDQIGVYNKEETQLKNIQVSNTYKESKSDIKEDIHTFDFVKYDWFTVVLVGLLVVRRLLVPIGL